VSRPLAGRRIAITWARRDGPDLLAKAIEEAGGTIFAAPAVTIGPPASYRELDAALADLSRFEWVVFSSANAVDHTLARCNGAASLRDLSIAAVGPATAARLAAYGLRVSVAPPAEESSGEGLARALAPSVRGRKVLVPRAAGGREELLDGLAAAGAEVTAVEAYRTVPVDPSALAPLGQDLVAGKLDAVVFASPSAVASVLAALGKGSKALGGITLAAIGPTTGDALRNAGFPAPVQPATPTGPELAAALAKALSL
jgi:uroporphyrinogen-III synthase/uroporphyrinogen III methyltransferase/synthase